MRLFIFGTGYTASHFVAAYRSQFAWIGGTVRSPEKARLIAASGIETFQFDGRTCDSSVVDAVSNAQAILVSIPPTTQGDCVLASFSDVIASAPDLRWIGYLSTIGVYGDTNGGWVDESSPPAPLNDRARHRVTAEEKWLALGLQANKPVKIFRLAGIYGPGRNALVSVADGTAQRIIKADQVFNRIHVDDIARVLLASMEHPDGGPVYNVVDNEPSPPQDVVAYAAKLLGRDPPPEVPFTEASLSPMARSFYEANRRVANKRIRQELRTDLLYPTYREGLNALFASGEGVHWQP